MMNILTLIKSYLSSSDIRSKVESIKNEAILYYANVEISARKAKTDSEKAQLELYHNDLTWSYMKLTEDSSDVEIWTALADWAEIMEYHNKTTDRLYSKVKAIVEEYKSQYEEIIDEAIDEEELVSQQYEPQKIWTYRVDGRTKSIIINQVLNTDKEAASCMVKTINASEMCLVYEMSQERKPMGKKHSAVINGKEYSYAEAVAYLRSV